MLAVLMWGLKLPYFPRQPVLARKKWNLLVLSARKSSSDIHHFGTVIPCVLLLQPLASIPSTAQGKEYCSFSTTNTKTWHYHLTLSFFFFSCSPAFQLSSLSAWIASCTQLLKRRRARASAHITSRQVSNTTENSHLKTVNYYQQKMILLALARLTLGNGDKDKRMET